MQKKPKVCILRTAGTNCDRETAHAFMACAAQAEFVHVKSLVEGSCRLSDYHILALPGGFSYGDDVASGKIFANELRCKLSEDIRRFIDDGKLVIGICNGFQILVKSGLLPGNAAVKPGLSREERQPRAFAQEASLIINDSGKFEDRWVYLRSKGVGPVPRTGREQKDSKCVWTAGLPETIYLPVAHGEGKFVVRDNAALERLKRNGQVVFQYCRETGGPAAYPFNPNGSIEAIAGICDQTGRILGLMPHPERHAYAQQHPRWTSSDARGEGHGLQIFRNGVEYARKHFDL